MTDETRRAVDGLRRAAAVVTDVVQPPELASPMSGMFRSAADRIELHGHTLGLPVNYDLEAAGIVLGEDLGHSR